MFKLKSEMLQMFRNFKGRSKILVKDSPLETINLEHFDWEVFNQVFSTYQKCQIHKLSSIFSTIWRWDVDWGTRKVQEISEKISQ